MGGCFLHRQEIPPQKKRLLTHHALKKTSKYLDCDTTSFIHLPFNTPCRPVAEHLFYIDTFVLISFAAREKTNSVGRIKIFLGPKLKLRHFSTLQPCSLLDEVNHTRIHHLHQWSGIQSNTQYEDSQWNQRSQFPIR